MLLLFLLPLLLLLFFPVLLLLLLLLPVLDTAEELFETVRELSALDPITGVAPLVAALSLVDGSCSLSSIPPSPSTILAAE